MLLSIAAKSEQASLVLGIPFGRKGSTLIGGGQRQGTTLPYHRFRSISVEVRYAAILSISVRPYSVRNFQRSARSRNSASSHWAQHLSGLAQIVWR